MKPSSTVTTTVASEKRKIRMQARTRTRLWVAVGILLIVVVGVGAGIAVSNANRKPVANGDSGAESTDSPEGTLTTEAPATGTKPDTGDTTTPPADGPSDEDGRHFTYIRAVSTVDGATVVVVDYAQMLTGAEAAAAATAAGEESPPPNDYFIVNENTLLRTFPVDTTISVRLTSRSDGVQPEGYEVGFGVWQDMFIGMIEGAGVVRAVPYWITIESGVITLIEEQYLP